MAWLHFKSVVWSLEVSYDLAPEETFFFLFFQTKSLEIRKSGQILFNEGFRF